MKTLKKTTKEKEIVKELAEWLNSPTWHLSTSTDYARGYKQGILMAKEIVCEIIKKYDKTILMD